MCSLRLPRRAVVARAVADVYPLPIILCYTICLFRCLYSLFNVLRSDIQYIFLRFYFRNVFFKIMSESDSQDVPEMDYAANTISPKKRNAKGKVSDCL